jgi:predicted nucleic acid-binding protein
VNTHFVDSNVLIAALGEPDTDFGRRSNDLVDRLITGAEAGHLEPTVMLETTFTLVQKLGLEPGVAATSILGILECEAVHCTDDVAVVEALRLWREQPRLSFADWYHLLKTREHKLDGIYSFDQAMDRLPGVTRVEP